MLAKWLAQMLCSANHSHFLPDTSFSLDLPRALAALHTLTGHFERTSNSVSFGFEFACLLISFSFIVLLHFWLMIFFICFSQYVPLNGHRCFLFHVFLFVPLQFCRPLIIAIRRDFQYCYTSPGMYFLPSVQSWDFGTTFSLLFKFYSFLFFLWFF